MATYEKVKNVVLGVTAVTAVVASAYTATNLFNKERDYSDILVESAKKYVENNNLAIESQLVASASRLKESGSLVGDLKDDCIDGSYVTVTNEDGTYKYEPSLVCKTETKAEEGNSTTNVENGAVAVDKKLTYKVNVSSTKLTNANVEVQVTFSEEIHNVSVQGWTLSSDKKVLTKVFTENGEDEFQAVSLDGYRSTNVKVSASNIDKDAPVILVNGKSAVSNYATGVNLNVKDTNLDSVKVNGEEITSYSINNTGDYEVVATDKAGNKTVANFSLGRAAVNPPKINKITDGGVYTTLPMRVTFSGSEAILYKIDGDTVEESPILSGGYIRQAGKYTLTVKNSVGDAVTVNFTIDNDDPEVWAETEDGNALSDGKATNKNVKIYFSDKYTKVTAKSNTLYRDLKYGEEFTKEGSYTITATDEAGHTKEFKFTIDRSIPIVNGVVDGKHYSNNRTIVFDSKGGSVTATLNGKEISSGHVVSEAGEYKLIVSTAAGNSNIVNFVVDKTAPTFKGFSASQDTIITGEDFEVEATDTYLKSVQVKKDNSLVASENTTLTEEGVYTLIATDEANNKTTKTVKIDKTAPAVTVGGTAPIIGVGAIEKAFEEEVSFSIQDMTDVTVKVDGKAFTGNTVTSNGRHTLEVTDAVGHKTIVYFTIAKDVPEVKLIAGGTEIIADNEMLTHYFNKDVTIKISNNVEIKSAKLTGPDGTADLTSEDILNGKTITAVDDLHKEYKLVVIDVADRSITVNFVIDQKNPISSVISETYTTDQLITFSDESGVTAKLDGVAIESGKVTLSEEGKHTLTLTDKAGNSVVYYPVIDKSAPTVSFMIDGKPVPVGDLTQKIYLNKATTLSLEDAYSLLKVSMNGEDKQTFADDSKSYSIGLSDDGEYSFIATDKANHVVEFTIVIDKVDPVGSISYENIDDPVTDRIVDKVKMTLTLDEKYTMKDSNNLVWEEVTSSIANKVQYVYTQSETISGNVTLTDKAGNTLVVPYNVTIDKVAPTAEVSYSTTEPISGDVEITMITSEPVTFTDELTWSEGTEITDGDNKGKYVYTATAEENVEKELNLFDGNNNKTVVKYSVKNIDKKVDLIGEEPNYFTYSNNGAATNQNVTVTLKAYEELTFEDTVLTWTESGPTKDENGKDVYTYTAIADNNYTNTLEIFDSLNNKVTITYKVTGIDTQGPDVTGFDENKYDEETDSYLFNSNITPVFTEGTAILKKKNAEGNYVTIEENFISGTEIGEANTDESYILEVKDDAGNKTIKNFRIDRLAPTATFTLSKKTPTNQAVTATITASEYITVTANADGITYLKGHDGFTYIIEEPGKITFRFEDEAGNVGSIEVDAPNIDKVEPTVEGVTDGGKYNAYVKDIIISDNKSGVTATLDGKEITGDALESGLGFKIAEIQDGVHTLVVTDTAGNSVTYTFTVDTISPIITGITNDGLYNSGVNPEFVEGTATLKRVYSVLENDELVEKTETIDDFKSGTLVDQEGAYTLTVDDGITTPTVYTFTIDRTAPTATISSETSNKKQYTNGYVLVTITTSEPINMVSNQEIFEVSADRKTYKFKVLENGEMIFRFQDKAGNESSKSIDVQNIDRTAPTISGVKDKGLYNATQVPLTITFTDDRELASSTIKGGDYNGDTFVSGNKIEKEGTYTLVVTDVADNSVEYTFEVDTTPPNVTLPEGGITVDGKLIYNKNVKPEYSEGTGVLKKKFVDDQGQESYVEVPTYNKEEAISEDGEYRLIVSDLAGNETVKEFTIDKNAPIVESITADVTAPTKESVTLTIKFNEATNMDTPVGTASQDRKTYTVVVSENGTVTFQFHDDAGNADNATFTVNNIDNEMKTGVITANKDNDTPTLAPVILTLTVGEPIKNLSDADLWTKVTSDSTPDTSLEDLPNATPAPDQTPVSYTREVRANGTYTVTYTDMAGNEGSATYTVSNIDTGAPTIEIIEGTNIEKYPSIYTGSVKVKVKDQNLKSITYTIDGVEQEPVDLTSLANGEIEVTFSEDGTYVINAIDIFDQPANPITFTIDKEAPVITVTAVDSANKITESLYNGSVKVTIDEKAENIEKILINGAEQSAVWNENTFSQDGTYTIKAIDKAGRESNEVTFYIDTIASTATVSYSTTDIIDGSVIVTVKVDEPITIAESGWTQKNDAIENGKTLSVYEKEVTANTNGLVTVDYKDEAQNSGSFEYIVSNIDTEDPTITVKEGTLVENKENLYSTVVTVEVSDFEDNIKEVYVNGELDTNFTTNKTKTFDKDGTYTIRVVDKAEHDDVKTIVVDVSKPVITIEGGNLMVVTTKDTLVMPNVSVEDIIDKNVQATIKTDVTEDGVRKVTYTATDEAGHVADDVVLEIRIIDITRLDKIEEKLDELEAASENVDFMTALANNKLDYTEASWNAKKKMISDLKDAIAGNREDIALSDITQTFVNDEIVNIENYELVSKDIVTDAFDEQAEIVEKLVKSDYTVSDELWNRIQTLATTELASIKVQSSLNKIVDDLKKELVELDKTINSITDDTADYKTKHKEIDYAGYADYIEALNQLSLDVQNKTIKLQSEYDKKIGKIEDALLATKNTIDDSELITLEAEFAKLDELDYTSGSYTALESALDAARKIVTDDGLISAYNDALDAVKTAKNALVAIPKVLNPVLKTICKEGTVCKPGYAKLGDTLVVEFESNSELNLEYIEDSNYATTFVIINGETVPQANIRTEEREGKTIYVAKLEVTAKSNEGLANYTIFPAGPVGPNQVVGTSKTYNSEITVDRTPAKTSLGVVPVGQTKGPVRLTLTATEQIIITSTEDVWTSSDTEGKVYTLDVTENKTVTVTYTDVAGNYGEKIIDITNIDNDAPTVTITADITEATKENVTLTLVASEPLESISAGWTPVSGKDNTYTYTVTESKVVTVEFADYAGNTGSETKDVTYIDKTPAVIGIPVYSNNGNATKDDVTITITSNEKLTFKDKDTLIDENGLEWEEEPVKDAEGNIVSYKYIATADDNYEASFKVLDPVGNESDFSYKVTGIDRTLPELKSIKSMKMAEGQRYTNMKSDILVITFNKPVKINTKSPSLVDENGVTLSEAARNEYREVQYFEVSVNFNLLTTFSDQLGNTGNIKYEVKQFDRVVPTLTSEIDALYGKNMNVEVTYDDYERDSENNVIENDHDVTATLIDENDVELAVLNGDRIKYGTEGASAEDGVILVSEGKYTLRITDEAGNFIEKNFEVDASGPAIDITNNGFKEDNRYAGPVDISVTDINGIKDAHIEVEGQDNIKIVNGKITLSEGGTYKVVATDNLDNTSELEFTIIATPELVSIKSSKMEEGQKYTNIKSDILVLTFSAPVKLNTKSVSLVDENGVTLSEEEREKFNTVYYFSTSVNFHMTMTFVDEYGQTGKVDYEVDEFYRETPTITVEGNKEVIVIKDTDAESFVLPTVEGSTSKEDILVTVTADKEFDKTQKSEQVITYTAKDEAGNTATKTITVRVLDTTGLTAIEDDMADLVSKATGSIYERIEANKDDYTLASWNAKQALIAALNAKLTAPINIDVDQSYVNAQIEAIENSVLTSNGVDLTEYNNLVNTFANLDSEDYDKEEYASIEEIIDNFDTENIDPTMLQSTFNKDTYLPLKAAIEELIKNPSKVVLVTDDYKDSFKDEDYSGKEAFLEGLNTLATQVEDGTIKLQSAYDAKVQELENALLLTKNAIVDTELVEIEADFAKMKAEDYTEATYEALQSAITAARAIVTDDGLVSEYNDAMTVVRNALSALKALPKIIAPVLASTGNTGYAKEGNEITVEFTSNKTLDLAKTTAMINGKTATLTSSTDEDGNVTYTAKITVAKADNNGKVTYEITPVDTEDLSNTTVTITEEESTVTVDTALPEVNLSNENKYSDGIYTGSVTVTITETNLKEVYVDGVVDATFGMAKTFPSGSHTIKAVDMAGNESLEVSFAIYTEGPEISFGELEDAIVTVKNKSIDLPTFTATDANGNTLETTVSKILYNGKDSQGNPIVDEVVENLDAIDYSRDGIYTITYSATDAAGLTGTKVLTIRVLNVDRYYTMKNEMDNLESMSQYGNFYTNQNKNKYDYTAKSFDDRLMMIEAMEYLTEPNLNSRFTQEMIDQYMDQVDSFKLIPEKLWLYDYNDQIAIIDSMTYTDYTIDSWMKVVEWKDKSTTGIKLQSDVNYYTASLKSVIEDLVKNPVTDTTESYKSKYQSVDYAGYGDYIAALNQLSSDVTDKKVDLISVYNDKLKEIEDALLLTRNSINDEELITFETEFAKMKAEDYTEATYEALQSAIAAARSIVTNGGLVSKYNDAMNAVKTAKDNLVIILKATNMELSTNGVTTLTESYAKVGDTLTLTFNANGALTLEDTIVTIIGKTATLSSSTNEDGTVTYTASVQVEESDANGKASYSVVLVGPNSQGNTINGTSDIIVDTEIPEGTVSYVTGSIGSEKPFGENDKTNGTVTIKLKTFDRLSDIIDSNGYNWLENGVEGEVDIFGSDPDIYYYRLTVSTNVEGTIVLKDKAGNESASISYSVDGIDTDAPTAEIVPSTTDLTNQDIELTLTPSEELKTISEGWTKESDGTYTMSVSEVGTYTATFTDMAGNTGSASITVNNIDRVKPVIGVSYTIDGIPFIGGFTNKDVTVTITSDKQLAKITDGNADHDWLATEQNIAGKYTYSMTFSSDVAETDLSIKDKAGNEPADAITYSINGIDKTKPTLKVTANGNLYPGGIIYGEVEVVAEDANLKSLTYIETIGGVSTTKTATVENGVASIRLGNDEEIEATYEFTAMDEANNQTSFSFAIDTKKPVITGVTNGETYENSVTATVTDANIKEVTYRGPESGTFEGTTHEFTVDGTYTVTATDYANNTTTVEFTIDQTLPEVTGVEDGGKYKTIPTITFDKGTATLNGTPFTSGSTVGEGKNQTLVVTSPAGTTTITFTVDTVAPNITSIEDGKVYKGSVAINYDDATTIPTGMIGDKLVANGSTFSEEGTHTLVVTDETGNKAEVTFTIDNTAPTLEITDNKGVKHTGDFEVTLEADKVNKFTNFEYTASDRDGVTVKVDIKGAVDLSKKGDYTLVYTATDDVGNTKPIKVTVHVKDTTAPVITMGENGKAIEVKYGSTFTDPYGATAIDAFDGPVGVDATNNVNIYQVGTYKITYTATDAEGNKSSKERTVKVVSTDTGALFRTANQCREGTQCYGSYASNNYVWYSGHLWRVIKVNPDNTLKLVAEDAASGFSFDDNSSVFVGSNAEKWLNNVFYPSLNNGDTIVTEGEFCNEKMTSLTNIRYTCSAGSVVKSKVGLLTIDEYNILGGQNGFLNNGIQYFTMTPTSEDTTWVVEDDGTKERGYYVTEPYAMRPVININAVTVLSGRGTETDPFVIDEGNKSSAGSKLTSSTSGEYVNFGGKKWRVVSSSNEGTKLITNDYVKLGSDYEGQAFGTAGVFNTSSGIGYYLNNTIYNGFTTKEKSLIKLSRWYNNQYTFGQNPMDTTLVAGSKYTDAYVGLIRVGELMSGSTTSTVKVDRFTYWTLNYSGTNSWFVSWGGTSEISPATNLRGIRPVITLADNVVIASGDGTEAHPYELRY